MTDFDLAAQPEARSSRLIDFEKAEVRQGWIPGTWFLVVRGTQPCVNMEVELVPLVYLECPEHWGIEVVGKLPSGICLPEAVPYHVSIPLAGITGAVGIEVIGASRSQQFKVSGGCTQGGDG